ncbi:MAG: hypothetical protein A2998_02790 [Candidatus Staskawiczbacteria bacterium RIFCSPLOWO2_01_FULL_37_25b]|uniref:Uncharacterized protein n=2 Tax=Candidatus Staskawicziibacteriota TaxID=1817916 RepID=A0A1G2HK75_9BACT|nr:MAG: hypothetical protein A2812_00555 [Candidatus Staskawiczbacteria bacterium RIFCSPHIGHO2_01_FULL_36_16]OGZ71833.1 MAG: hypothetical protein A2998_02790 [Candidatus Staskawiczbacteria bacterium RIFCSPLOWO2_01_FULL_37_25b]
MNKLFKSFIYGSVSGLVLSLLPLLAIPLLYNLLGFIVFALPGAFIVIINLYGHLNWILVVFLYFIINILYYGLIGIILSVFLEKIDKKLFLLLIFIFILFIGSSYPYLYFLSKIGQPSSGSPYGKALDDPRQECLKDGGQWMPCAEIKDGYSNPRDYLTTADYCKNYSTTDMGYSGKRYLNYPNYGCNCGIDSYWSFSWNTCIKPYAGNAKRLDQLQIMEIGIILNSVLLFIVSLGIGFLKRIKNNIN